MTLFDWKTTDGLDKRGKRKKLGQTTHAAQVGGYWLALSSQDNAEIPIPTRLAICYVLKDTLEVEWRYVSLNRASDAFAAACRVYNSTKESLYE